MIMFLLYSNITFVETLTSVKLYVYYDTLLRTWLDMNTLMIQDRKQKMENNFTDIPTFC